MDIYSHDKCMHEVSSIDPDDDTYQTEISKKTTGKTNCFWTSNRANLLIVGGTMSGKTCFLHTILRKCILKQAIASDIYIFSRKAKEDLSYRQLIMYLIKNTTTTLNIFESIDMSVINTVVEEQRDISMKNLVNDSSKRVPLRKIIFIFDDIIGDAELKSYQSELSAFTAMS